MSDNSAQRRITPGASGRAERRNRDTTTRLPSAAYRLATVDLPSWAVVVAPQDATVRFEPSASGTAHFQARPGSMVRIVGEREGWVQVVRGDGRRGWLERDAVAALWQPAAVGM